MERVLLAQKTRAEVELRRSKEYYQRLVETVKAIPWELDPADWRFTYIGPQARQLLGHSMAGGCPYSIWAEKIHPEDRLRVRMALRDALLPNRDQDFVHRILAVDGNTFWMRSIVTSLSRDGRPPLLRGFTVDITAAKKAEEALARRAEELARSNKDLEDFAYVASHDLQEPLRMVSSYTELLAERYRGRLDSDADEFIGFITQGVARMQQMIRDLLAYSRVSTQGSRIAPTSSETILLRALDNLRAAIRESEGVVKHDPLPVVPADPIQLTQVFQNLVGNSLKFRGTAPPEVRVSAREDAGGWTFSVIDNGIGIDPQYSEVIFGLFQRLHTTQEYPGTGIGLTFCRKIVERHGGTIWVESKLGGGAAFHFTIPKACGSGS
jgi:PAS domain S-box-containing protein